VELLRADNYEGCKDVAVELHARGFTATVVHPTTISRHVKAHAPTLGTPVRVVRGNPKKALTPDTITKGLTFCKANLRRNWDNVMITDRCKFFFRLPGSRVKRSQWLFQGEQHSAFKPNKPSCINLYAGITTWGVNKAHLVTGTTKHTSKYKNMNGEAA
jgi:hypothetical protein